MLVLTRVSQVSRYKLRKPKRLTSMCALEAKQECKHNDQWQSIFCGDEMMKCGKCDEPIPLNCLYYMCTKCKQLLICDACHLNVTQKTRNNINSEEKSHGQLVNDHNWIQFGDLKKANYQCCACQLKPCEDGWICISCQIQLCNKCCFTHVRMDVSKYTKQSKITDFFKSRSQNS